MRIPILLVIASGLCWSQGTDECPTFVAQHSGIAVSLRLSGWAGSVPPGGARREEGASAVGQDLHETVRGADGGGRLPILSLVIGFHYFSFDVDGANARRPVDPHLLWQRHGTAAASRSPSRVDAAYYAAEGRTSRPGEPAPVRLKVTEKWRRCYVYTLPGLRYRRRTATRFWTRYTAGARTIRAGMPRGMPISFLDNLIAAKKAEPMIIVMDNPNAAKPGEDAAHLLRPAGSWPRRRPTELPPGGRPAAGPRGRPGKLHRRGVHRDDVHRPDPGGRADLGCFWTGQSAMAGMSMGGTETFMTTSVEPGQVRLHRRFHRQHGRPRRIRSEDLEQRRLRGCRRVQQEVKLFFLGIGSVEGPGHQKLQRGVNKGGHQQHIFRVARHGSRMVQNAALRCLNDFAPRLFK